MSEQLSTTQEYMPALEIREQLDSVHFVPIIGPSGMGKNALAVGLEVDSGGLIKKVISHTSRLIREHEGEVDGVAYVFHEPTEELIERLRNDETAQAFVQIAQHPYNEDVKYWTYIDEYNVDGFSVIDMLPTAVEDMRNLFTADNMTEIVLTASFSDMMKRFDARNGGDSAEYSSRLNEARQSIEWSLDNPRALWIINESGKLDTAVSTVRAYLHDGIIPNQETAKEYARGNLERINAMLDSTRIAPDGVIDS